MVQGGTVFSSKETALDYLGPSLPTSDQRDLTARRWLLRASGARRRTRCPWSRTGNRRFGRATQCRRAEGVSCAIHHQSPAAGFWNCKAESNAGGCHKNSVPTAQSGQSQRRTSGFGRVHLVCGNSIRESPFQSYCPFTQKRELPQSVLCGPFSQRRDGTLLAESACW